MGQSIEAIVSKAILTKYNATAALTTAIPGGLHREKVRGASAGTAQTRPYAVYQIRASNRNKQLAGGDVIDRRTVTFFIYDSATNMATADAAVDALRSAFHAQALTDTTPTYSAISVLEKPIDEGQLIPFPQRQGESQWQAAWQMEVTSAI